MNKIYLLQVSFDSWKYNHQVYSNLKLAKEVGKKWLENEFRKEYENLFEEDLKGDSLKTNLSKEEVFKIKAIYDFTITELEPDRIDKLNYIENLPLVNDIDIYDLYSADLEPAKIEHSYDYNGKEIYITGIYIFNHNGKIKERKVMMEYEDYINPLAGTKFKKGDIVKIKKDYNSHSKDYIFCNKLHVITDIPHKNKNQKFFRNSYKVLTNHNSYDEGCHIDVFNEKELELYTDKLPNDSPILFLSKYFKGEIKLNNIRWSDIECGRITLNENKSFRDVPEIMEQMKGKNIK